MEDNDKSINNLRERKPQGNQRNPQNVRYDEAKLNPAQRFPTGYWPNLDTIVVFLLFLIVGGILYTYGTLGETKSPADNFNSKKFGVL